MSFSTSNNSIEALICSTTNRLLNLLDSRNFAVQLPDKTIIPPSDGQATDFTLILHDPTALRRMFLLPNQFRMGEEYVLGSYDIDGDILAALEFFENAEYIRPSAWEFVRIVRDLYRLEASAIHDQKPTKDIHHEFSSSHEQNSVERDTREVQYHYDMSNDAYKLWLDKRMVYSCARFLSAEDSLDIAQLQQLDSICQKLELKEAERLLDIGCGWGALFIHAASKYGVSGTGITLSAAQCEEANQRIEAIGFSGKCTAQVKHYREYYSDTQFDKITSIEMVEHIGSNLDEFFSKVHKLLLPNGKFLIQATISKTTHARSRRQDWARKLGFKKDFVDTYIFPGSHLHTLPELLLAGERANFRALSVESYYSHFPLTLRAWLDGLEKNETSLVKLIGREHYRALRIGLYGYLLYYLRGRLDAHQILFEKLEY